MKPKATYRAMDGKPTVGGHVFLHDVKNHPQQQLGTMKGKLVLTSMIVAVRDHGEIETINTIYTPE